MWSAKERYLPFYHLLHEAGRSLRSRILCSLSLSLSVVRSVLFFLAGGRGRGVVVVVV